MPAPDGEIYDESPLTNFERGLAGLRRHGAPDRLVVMPESMFLAGQRPVFLELHTTNGLPVLLSVEQVIGVNPRPDDVRGGRVVSLSGTDVSLADDPQPVTVLEVYEDVRALLDRVGVLIVGVSG